MLKAGQTIKTLRTLKGVTQTQLAERSGVSKFTVCNTESGGNPTLMNFESMLEALGYRIKVVPIEEM